MLLLQRDHKGWAMIGVLGVTKEPPMEMVEACCDL